MNTHNNHTNLSNDTEHTPIYWSDEIHNYNPITSYPKLHKNHTNIPPPTSIIGEIE
jgi:hypothetical protein